MVVKFKHSFINIKNKEEYLHQINSALNNNKLKTFFYLNSYSFYLADKNKEFRKAFNNADYVIADGFSIVLLTKILYKIKIKKVVFTYLFFNKISHLLKENNSNIFILGGNQDTIEKTNELLKSSRYNLNIVGFSNGFFTESSDLIKNINSSGTDVLICGMGMPKSEIWIQNNLSKLKIKCVFSVGGFFDFLVKNRKTAPNIFYNSGFEWVHRLFQEPKRLFRRYLVANTYFIFQLLSAIFTHNENRSSL